VKKYVDTWLLFDLVEMGFVAVLIWFTSTLLFNPLLILIVYILFRLLIRALASLRYHKLYL
jgi:hypothetical protein